jgi:hypothetical protein
MPVVTLAGVDVPLKTPESASARWDVYSAATTNPNRAFAAALALCWDGPKKPRTKLQAHRFDALSFGGAVLDELVSRGVPLPEVIGAGLVAWKLCGDGLITGEEVEAAEDFSGGEEA